METEKAARKLVSDLERLLKRRVGPVFKKYDLEIATLLTPLKWQPLVLVIGNYSSGKSTFINELLGRSVQRTGQAPTDDCFTVLTKGAGREEEAEIPGGNVVNDERLPFASLKHFGESLLAHLRLKRVESPILEGLAIVDTPGMLDSVTEKDRGYDYLGVVSELARLADLIILMFDPHKAGTIKETYQAIRSTLPGATGEDRVLYVLNRIDECENGTDLVKSFGTLCWNLSQMTGRKDIPRIYLTFAAQEGQPARDMAAWTGEREELKKAVLGAPRMRLNHILQEVDRGVRELLLQTEALGSFKRRLKERLRGVSRGGLLVALLVFLFGDLLTGSLAGYPETSMLSALLAKTYDWHNFVIPGGAALVVLGFTSVFMRRWLIPRTVKKTLADLDSLVVLDTAYRKDLWRRVRDRVGARLAGNAGRQLWTAHDWHRQRLERFLDRDLARLYERVHSG